MGIDFGLAFGNGLGLPAPELIPFRLTQQVKVAGSSRLVLVAHCLVVMCALCVVAL